MEQPLLTDMKFLAFVGPGSTGKTTLTGKLAHHFITIGYKEYLSKEISDNRPSYGLKSPGTDFYVLLQILQESNL